VGIYLRLEAGLQGQAIFVIPLPIALNLVDFLMDARPGTSVELGLMERSALAEVGNLMLSYFLNAVADLAEVSEVLQPSPPEVMVDMLGAILDVVTAPAAFVSDELLVVESLFRDRARTIWIRFWVLPAPDIVEGPEG
jgi:chemotaxis protein CheC